MRREEIIDYIRQYDPFFIDAHLEDYSSHELALIKISIDVEKEKKINDENRPIKPGRNIF